MVENICEKYHKLYLEDLVSWLDPRSYKSNFNIIQLTRCFWVFRICFERPIPCTPWTFKCSFSHFILWKKYYNSISNSSSSCFFQAMSFPIKLCYYMEASKIWCWGHVNIHFLKPQSRFFKTWTSSYVQPIQ
jgi:hypothetical protein